MTYENGFFYLEFEFGVSKFATNFGIFLRIYYRMAMVNRCRWLNTLTTVVYLWNSEVGRRSCSCWKVIVLSCVSVPNTLEPNIVLWCIDNNNNIREYDKTWWYDWERLFIYGPFPFISIQSGEGTSAVFNLDLMS